MDQVALEKELKPTNLFVVDETSMVDINLASAMLKILKLVL